MGDYASHEMSDWGEFGAASRLLLALVPRRQSNADSTSGAKAGPRHTRAALTGSDIRSNVTSIEALLAPCRVQRLRNVLYQDHHVHRVGRRGFEAMSDIEGAGFLIDGVHQHRPCPNRP